MSDIVSLGWAGTVGWYRQVIFLLLLLGLCGKVRAARDGGDNPLVAVDDCINLGEYGRWLS